MENLGNNVNRSDENGTVIVSACYYLGLLGKWCFGTVANSILRLGWVFEVPTANISRIRSNEK